MGEICGNNYKKWTATSGIFNKTVNMSKLLFIEISKRSLLQVVLIGTYVVFYYL